MMDHRAAYGEGMVKEQAASSMEAWKRNGAAMTAT